MRRELSEYTSLIRTLHTTSTQDLLPHLTRTFPRPPSAPLSPHLRKRRSLSAISHPSQASSTVAHAHHRADGSGSDEEGEDKTSETTPSSPRSEQRLGIDRDLWTRWPLLRDSVYVPEWTLQDEVKSIAERAARRWLEAHADEELTDKPINRPSSVLHDSGVSSENRAPDRTRKKLDIESMAEDAPSRPPEPTSPGVAEKVLPLPEEELLTKGVLDGLYLEASTLLSQILAALAAHRPAADPGLQNRLRTMDWKDALNVISSAGIVEQW